MLTLEKSSMSIAHRIFGVFFGISSLVVMTSTLAGCTTEVTPDVFDSAVLHRIEITVDAAQLDQLETDLDNRVLCTIVYDGEQVEVAGIRQKGNTAIPLDAKPSFSVKFDEFDSRADLHGFNKILLNNSQQDPTFLREKLGANLHAQAGLPAGRIVHAQVTFNGVDKGIYVIAEAIDKDFLQLHFGKENDDGNLYEGPCCGDFAIDTNYRDTEMHLDDEKKDGRSRDDIDALAQIILNAPDATFATDVAKKLDLDKFMKIYALEALIGHADGFAFRGNNYYLYDDPAVSRFVFVPHGMDRILDSAAFDPLQSPAMKLPLRIRAIAELDKQFQDQLAQFETSVWNESTMQATIDETVALLRNAGSGPQTIKDLAALDTNVTNLRNIVTIRSAAMKP